jgi:cytoskeletal protein CcmA (bactofilin family)
MKKYLEDLKKELNRKGLNEKVIEDILNDYKEMLNQAIEDGLNESDIEKKFGTPNKVAREIAQDEQGNPKKEQSKPEDDDEFRLWKSFEIKKDTIDLTIKLIDDDVMIKSTEESKISIHCSGGFNEDQYQLEVTDDLIKLTSPPFKGFKFNQIFKSHQKTSFLILIPEELLIGTFVYTVVNSDLIIEDVKANQFNLSTTNGDIDIHRSYLGNFKINTVSGDVKCTNVYVDTINSSQVSGDTTFDHCTINKHLKVNMVSGDVVLNHSTCEILESTSVSGDITGTEFYPKKIDFKTLSGDINLKNKHREHIEIKKNGVFSGSINIDL